MTTAPETIGFRLPADEPLADGVRRVLTDQLDKALAHLRSEDDPDTGVHEMRKALKRSRAVLRLVRHVVGEDAYRRENVALRDAARRWGQVRDSVVLVTTATDLSEGMAEATDPVVTRLRREADAALADAFGSEEPRQDTAAVLEAVRTRVPALTSGPAWADARPGPGVERVLHRARRHRRKAKRAQSSEALHRWRKDVKYLTYHAELLVERVGADAEAVADDLGDLGSLLGDEHDLAVLAETLTSDDSLAEATRAGWLEVTGRRRADLADGALTRGKQVLREARVLTRA